MGYKTTIEDLVSAASVRKGTGMPKNSKVGRYQAIAIAMQKAGRKKKGARKK